MSLLPHPLQLPSGLFLPFIFSGQPQAWEEKPYAARALSSGELCAWHRQSKRATGSGTARAPQLTEEKPRAHMGECVAQGHPAHQWQSQALNAHPGDIPCSRSFTREKLSCFTPRGANFSHSPMGSTPCLHQKSGSGALCSLPF